MKEKKKFKEKILEQGYSIEVLEDEISDLEEQLSETKTKLWEIIQENDRLTLTYEPYRPTGDENEGVNFYDLFDENKELKATVRQLEQEVVNLNYKLRQVEKSMVEMKPAGKQPRIKYDRWWNASFELWPGAWNCSYYRYQAKKHGSKSREGQVQVGPFGFSWNREPKRG